MKASLVIPTRDQELALGLTLASICSQQASEAEFEVIIVNDGSRDGTAVMLDRFSAGFPFKVIHLPEPRGAAAARNAGVRAAEGDVVIFADGDCVLAPDFVAEHQRFHRERADQFVVASGAAQRDVVYSVYFPDFSTDALQNLEYLAGQSNRLNERLVSARREGQPTLLLEPAEVAGGQYRPWTFTVNNPVAEGFQRLRDQTGPDLRHIPGAWQAFITRNVSVNRAALREAGLFCEDFIGWGCEDSELGFRLHKLGMTFWLQDTARNFHQEHPVDWEARSRDARRNQQIFTATHPEFEIQVLWSNFRPQGVDVWALIQQYHELQAHREFADLLAAMAEMAREYRDAYFGEGALPPGGWDARAAVWGQERLRQLQDQFSRLDDWGTRRALAAAREGADADTQRRLRWHDLLSGFYCLLAGADKTD